MDGTISAPKVDWDYTAHAALYDERADYSRDAIGELLGTIGCTPGKPVADIGAGTGKLTRELLRHGLEVGAVEPHEATRTLGMRNTEGEGVTWSFGTAESTGLRDRSTYAVFFGGSFNLVDRKRALVEAARVLVSGGWLACMWNHCDLKDPVRQRIEAIIRSHIPGYSYSARPENPTAVICASRLYSAVNTIEGSFVCNMSRSDIVAAWASHATLRRQAGNDALFERIVGEISRYLDRQSESVDVRYTTRIYYAQSLR
jgi:ubiquinone/menaquinone biosynthesis C-methylase UbiE